MGQLSAGCASRDITPPPGLDIAGGLSPSPSQGTRDPLVCKALVLDDGATRAALVALVAIPGELFVELGREIERRSPFACTVIVTLANDWVGYQPHRRAFDEGGYETLYASQSRLAPEAGELVVEAAVRLLVETRAAVEAAR